MAPRNLEPDAGYVGLCPPGLRQSGTHGLKERKGAYRAKLAYLARNAINAQPIFTMSGALKKQMSVTDPEYRWHEKHYAERNVRLSAAYDDAGGMSGTVATVTVYGSTWMLHNGVQLKNHFTSEIMQVVCSPTVVDPTGRLPVQVQVIRGFAGTTPTAFDPNDPIVQGLCGGEVVLHMIGTAFPENSCNPDSIHRDPGMNNQLLQIFRKGHSISGTAKATGYKFGPKEQEDKREIAELFNEDVEAGLLFGEMSITRSQDGKILRTTHGLVNQIRDRAPDNYIVRNPTSRMGLKEFEEMMSDQIFLYGSKEKVAFCGFGTMKVLRALQRMNTQAIEMTQNEKVLGRMVVTTFRLMGYTLHVHEHPSFRDAGYPWSNSMLILDMADLEFLVLKGRDVKYRQFTSLDKSECGLDGDVYGWLGEMAAVLVSAKRHGVIQGICEAGEDCYECATPAPYENPTPLEDCDPCLQPAVLDDTSEPYVCETCGTGGCGCGKLDKGGMDGALAPLTDNDAVLDQLLAGNCDADDDGIPDLNDIDRDGDGVDNETDTDPDDPNVQ